MRTIHKFPMQVQDSEVFMMPEGAEVLCVQAQAGVPCAWALVEPGRALQPKTLRTYGTGHQILVPRDRLRYVGTYQMNGGTLVFHVFEELRT